MVTGVRFMGRLLIENYVIHDITKALPVSSRRADEPLWPTAAETSAMGQPLFQDSARLFEPCPHALQMHSPAELREASGFFLNGTAVHSVMT
jgi:hypothetical protein